ncbi:hypothetical protein BDV3_000946 [Batrachochytrium dendrobatidis]
MPEVTSTNLNPAASTPHTIVDPLPISSASSVASFASSSQKLQPSDSTTDLSLATSSLTNNHRESVWRNNLWAAPGRINTVTAPSISRQSIQTLDSNLQKPQSSLFSVRRGLTTGILGSIVENLESLTLILKPLYKPNGSSDYQHSLNTICTATPFIPVSRTIHSNNISEPEASATLESSSKAFVNPTHSCPVIEELDSVEDMEIMHAKQGSQASRRKSTDARPKEATPIQVDEETKMMADIAKLNSLSIRCNKFKAILEQPNVDLEQLRKLSWPGIPTEIRPTAWKLLMGYLPANSDRRDSTLIRKRKEYEEYVLQAYSRGTEGLDQGLSHQIHIDIQRTNAHMPLYQHPIIQEALERILYVWAIRHPASGYVQGINDLVTSFFQVFLQEVVSSDVEKIDPAQISPETLTNVQADTFWCLTKLLDGIQDNYTHKQPGIQRQIFRLKELINRIDAPLHNHLAAQGIEFLQFSFRWMNCMLMREISLGNTIRMWDTYLAEGSDGFSDFHLYVCAAFLVKWSAQLRSLEFQDIMMHLQSPPTAAWTEKDIELLLSEAFMWKSLFHNSPNHLSSNGSGASSMQLQ